MKRILLKSALVPASFGSETRKDIIVADGRFVKIADKATDDDADGAEVVDCSRFAVFPAFYNGHSHAAMSILRGYADDMPLQKWLQEYIWPFEAKITADDIEIAARLAVLEMIKSGTVFFADMYWHREHTMKVVEEMGIRASIGVTFAESLMSPEAIEKNFEFLSKHTGESDRVSLAVAPHSVYTVGEKLLMFIYPRRSRNWMIAKSSMAVARSVCWNAPECWTAISSRRIACISRMTT